MTQDDRLQIELLTEDCQNAAVRADAAERYLRERRAKLSAYLDKMEEQEKAEKP